jgi:membrane protein YqaA with SNARE-associated domain
MSKWKFLVLPALLKLGFWGVGLISLIDASTLPVPMDALLAVYVWADKPHFWAYCLMASAGSAIGGLLPLWGWGGGVASYFC